MVKPRCIASKILRRNECVWPVIIRNKDHIPSSRIQGPYRTMEWERNVKKRLRVEDVTDRTVALGNKTATTNFICSPLDWASLYSVMEGGASCSGHCFLTWRFIAWQDKCSSSCKQPTKTHWVIREVIKAERTWIAKMKEIRRGGSLTRYTSRDWIQLNTSCICIKMKTH